MPGGGTAMARMKPRTWYFLGGFAFGVIASVLYLLFGTWAWGAPEPEWAQIVFAPASFVGFFVYLSLHAFPEMKDILFYLLFPFVSFQFLSGYPLVILFPLSDNR